MSTIKPAHPRIADALCKVAENFADAAEPAWIELTDWRTELKWIGLFAVGLFVYAVVYPTLRELVAVLP
jgi:hypothetical protein